MQTLLELLGVRALIETLAGAATCAADAVDAWIARTEERYRPVEAGVDAGYAWLLWALSRPLERDPKAKKTS
jgi:hypothetical protein